MKNELLAERLTAVLALLCGEEPDPEIVAMWRHRDFYWPDDPGKGDAMLLEWIEGRCCVCPWPEKVVEWARPEDLLAAAKLLSGSDRLETPTEP